MTETHSSSAASDSSGTGGGKYERLDRLVAFSLVVGSVLYRPLTFWGNNAWDLSAPQDLLPAVLVEAILALALFWLLARATHKPYLAAVIVTVATFTLLNWYSVEGGLALAVFAGVSIGAIYLTVRGPTKGERYVALVGIALTIGLPTVQLVFGHLQDRAGYPLRPEVAKAESYSASGTIEDMVLLIVDGYPMAHVARTWFGHESSDLERTLDAARFTTPDISWSHNTFTSLALPTVLAMDQVVTADSKSGWQNLKPNYDRTRGHNRTVRILQDAGFKYVHVESGWNGDRCGLATTCVGSSWLDEANWQMLSTSLFGHWMKTTWGSPSVANTQISNQHLLELDVFENGTREFVYVHFMLPHSPFVVDGDCRRLSPIGNEAQREDPARIDAQLACVDGMLESFVSILGDAAAVVIAGDHGTATLGQNYRSADQWTDKDIAERLGAFLAYRLPEKCEAPRAPTNASASASMVACAIDQVSPPDIDEFVLGLTDQVAVGPDRLRTIEEGLLSGAIGRDS